MPRKQAERKLLSSLDRTRETNPLASPASPAARLCNLPARSAARGVDRGIPPGNAAQHAKRPAGGNIPCGPLSAHATRLRASPRAQNRASIEKRPPRARRPALPQPRAAVLSAKAGLTAEFGMGSGDPRLCGCAHAGRSRPHAGTRATLGAAWRPKRRIHPFQAPPFLEVRMGARARPISTARLNASRRLQLRPIYHVFCMGAYRRENSSRRRLPA